MRADDRQLVATLRTGTPAPAPSTVRVAAARPFVPNCPQAAGRSGATSRRRDGPTVRQQLGRLCRSTQRLKCRHRVVPAAARSKIRGPSPETDELHLSRRPMRRSTARPARTSQRARAVLALQEADQSGVDLVAPCCTQCPAPLRMIWPSGRSGYAPCRRYAWRRSGDDAVLEPARNMRAGGFAHPARPRSAPVAIDAAVPVQSAAEAGFSVDLREGGKAASVPRRSGRAGSPPWRKPLPSSTN